MNEKNNQIVLLSDNTQYNVDKTNNNNKILDRDV